MGEGIGVGVPTPPVASPANDDVTTAQSEFWEPGDEVCCDAEARRAGGGLSRERGLGEREIRAQVPRAAKWPGLSVGTGRG